MWRRASGLRRGFTSQLDSAFINDDMVAAPGPGTSSSSCAAAGRVVLHLLAPGAGKRSCGGRAWVRGRGLGPAGPLATKWAGY
jgi:hypothetical protein